MKQLLARVRSILKRRRSVELAVMALDRIVRPFGLGLISFTRYAAVPAPRKEEASERQFDRIAADNLWGSAESLSGKGSEIHQSAPYRARLVRLIEKRNFASMFDAPCGDLNWMRLVLEQCPIDYLGGDISATVVELNRTRYPQLRFTRFDVTRDTFPAADVWHCRDCLFHLSEEDIFLALRNFVSSKIPFALITNHRGMIRNVDIETGGWRYLDLMRAPFNLPRPLERLSDYRFGDLPQMVGLWSRAQIEQAMSAPAQAAPGNG